MPDCLLAAFLVDIYGSYKYLFFMSGSVILTGGLFLLVMNIYNYHQLSKEEETRDPKRDQKDSATPEHVMKEASENVTKQVEPKTEMVVESQNRLD